MPSVKSGLAAQIGFATETTVNTPATPTLFLPFVDESLTYTPGRTEAASIIANRRTLDSSQWNGGVSEVGGDIGLELYNRSLGRIFRHMFGGLVTTGAGPYTHTFTPGDLSGLSFTAQVGVPGVAVEPKTVSGAKMASWEMAFAAGEITTLGLSVVGQSMQMGSRTVTDGATTNTDATATSATAAFTAADIGKTITGTGIPAGTKILSINSATSVELTANATATASGLTFVIGFPLATASYAANMHPLKFNHGTVTLDGTELAVVTGGSISGDNGLDTSRSFIGTTDIAEPIETTKREYAVSLTTQFETNTQYDLMRAGDEVALVLDFTSGADSVTFTTNVRIDQAGAAVAGESIVEQEITAKCIGDGTDASAITAVLVNSDSSAT